MNEEGISFEEAAKKTSIIKEAKRQSTEYFRTSGDSTVQCQSLSSTFK